MGRSVTRSHLSETAARHFRLHGYAGTTTRRLSAALGIRSASLYHYMGKKEDLLYELSMDAIGRLQHAVEEAISSTASPADRIRALIVAHVTGALAVQDQHAVMLIELRALSPERQAKVLEKRDEYEKLVERVIAAAQDAEEVRTDIETRYLTLALLNLLNWTIFWYRPDGKLSPTALAEVLATVFLEGASAASGVMLARRSREVALP